jgi:hypothetical protein
MENYVEPKKNWLETYVENYNGDTLQAKALNEFTKQTYKSDFYVPWATMERLALTQDPDFDIEVVRNKESGLVETTFYKIDTYSKNQDKEIHSSVDIASHMVVLKGTFLGKTMFEYYPIQDAKYEAVKIIDQNLINKAIQRGKTKLTSRLTGLALKLYEGLDLQFETKEEPIVSQQKVEPKQETPITTTKSNPIVQPKEEPKTETKLDEVYVLARYLHENREVLKKGMEEMNAVLKQKGFTFDLDNDGESEIYAKLKDVKMPSIFVKAVKAKSGVQ